MVLVSINVGTYQDKFVLLFSMALENLKKVILNFQLSIFSTSKNRKINLINIIFLLIKNRCYR